MRRRAELTQPRRALCGGDGRNSAFSFSTVDWTSEPFTETPAATFCKGDSRIVELRPHASASRLQNGWK
eukprot:8828981-Alexandrium_andersonii.AAC.1